MKYTEIEDRTLTRSTVDLNHPKDLRPNASYTGKSDLTPSDFGLRCGGGGELTWLGLRWDPSLTATEGVWVQL